MKFNNYVAGALPDLEWNIVPEKRLQQFLDENAVMLHSYENDLLEFTLFNDIKNIELLLKQQFDIKNGKNSEDNEITFFTPYIVDNKFLEKFIDQPFVWHPEEYPMFMVEFLEKYTDVENRYSNIEELYVEYFMYLENHEKPFFKYYGRLFGTLFTIIAAYRLIRSNQDLEEKLKGPPLVVQTILENRSTSDLGMKTVFWDLPEVIALFDKGPLDLEHAFDKLVFHLLEGVGAEEPFGNHIIYSYIIKYFILDRWNTMSKAKGNEILEKIISE